MKFAHLSPPCVSACVCASSLPLPPSSYFPFSDLVWWTAVIPIYSFILGFSRRLSLLLPTKSFFVDGARDLGLTESLSSFLLSFLAAAAAAATDVVLNCSHVQTGEVWEQERCAHPTKLPLSLSLSCCFLKKS